MKRWKKILIWLTGTAILLVVAVFALFYLQMRPTTGPQIDVYSTPRTALIIIDIQEDYTGPQAKSRYRDGDRIVYSMSHATECLSRMPCLCRPCRRRDP